MSVCTEEVTEMGVTKFKIIFTLEKKSDNRYKKL